MRKKVISSTLIRNFLQKGKLDKVNRLLNRSWSIVGKVQKGRQLGKKLGFPTANIDIKDYGKGFDTKHLNIQGGGNGLLNMKERAGFVGGKIEVKSNINQGTLISVEVPIEEN